MRFFTVTCCKDLVIQDLLAKICHFNIKKSPSKIRQVLICWLRQLNYNEQFKQDWVCRDRDNTTFSFCDQETCCQKHLLRTHVSPMLSSFATREYASAVKQKHVLLLETIVPCGKSGDHRETCARSKCFGQHVSSFCQGFEAYRKRVMNKYCIFKDQIQVVLVIKNYISFIDINNLIENLLSLTLQSVKNPKCKSLFCQTSKIVGSYTRVFNVFYSVHYIGPVQVLFMFTKHDR